MKYWRFVYRRGNFLLNLSFVFYKSWRRANDTIATSESLLHSNPRDLTIIVIYQYIPFKANFCMLTSAVTDSYR